MTPTQHAEAQRQLAAPAAPNPIERVKMQIIQRRQMTPYPGAVPIWVTDVGKWELF